MVLLKYQNIKQKGEFLGAMMAPMAVLLIVSMASSLIQSAASLLMFYLQKESWEQEKDM